MTVPIRIHKIPANAVGRWSDRDASIEASGSDAAGSCCKPADSDDFPFDLGLDPPLCDELDGVAPGGRGDAVARFLKKVEIRGLDECWPWTGSISPKGYGRFRVTEHGNAGYAHRAAWELFVGPIPDSLTIDHLCRNRACVNLEHLEVVTPSENTRRARSAA